MTADERELVAALQRIRSLAAGGASPACIWEQADDALEKYVASKNAPPAGDK